MAHKQIKTDEYGNVTYFDPFDRENSTKKPETSTKNQTTTSVQNNQTTTAGSTSLSTSVEPIPGVSQKKWDEYFTPVSKGNNTVAAQEYLQGILDQINNRTPNEQLESVKNQIMNMEKFSYDFSKDPMFQQMLALQQNMGKMAMQDTVAQGAALTGGYSNSWAQTAGQQAYNQSLQEAYANLPAYYQLALDAHNLERSQLIERYDLLSAEDQKAYNELMDQYGIGLDQLKTAMDIDSSDKELLGAEINLLNSEATRKLEEAAAAEAAARSEYNSYIQAGFTKDENGNWVAPVDDSADEFLYENVIGAIKNAYNRYVGEDGDEKRFQEFIEKDILEKGLLDEYEIDVALALAGINTNYNTSSSKNVIDLFLDWFKK